MVKIIWAAVTENTKRRRLNKVEAFWKKRLRKMRFCLYAINKRPLQIALVKKGECSLFANGGYSTCQSGSGTVLQHAAIPLFEAQTTGFYVRDVYFAYNSYAILIKADRI